MQTKDLIRLQEVDDALVKLAHAVAVKFPQMGIAQGARTLEQSIENKAKGVSWLKNPANSKHIPKPGKKAMAFDFFLRSPDGGADWTVEHYLPVVEEFERQAKLLGIKIVCGYRWKQRDAGHVELV